MADNVARLGSCLANQEIVLNLGNCGLSDDDLCITGELGRLLAQCTHVKTLILSNYYYDWTLHEPPVLGFNARYIYHQKDTSWEKGFKTPRWHEPIDYFHIPTFRPLVAIGAGRNSDNKLTTIPPIIACLPNLEVLVCGGHKFNKWEIDSLEPLRGLDQLKTLILSNNAIKEADCLHWFPNLEKLDLSNNNITHLHKITRHPNIEYLDLSNNQLSHAYEIRKLPNLRWLSLSNNRLDTMDGVNALPLLQLQVLDLSTNTISDFRPFETNTSLEKLNLSNNLFRHLDHVGEIPRLKCLFARCNRIKQVKGINNLRQLQILDLSHNMIAQLPASFKGLKELEILDLSNNHLQELAHIFLLPKLRLVNASTNYIEYVNCRTECPFLEELNLNNNRLSILRALPYFRNLKKLFARENEIEEVICRNNAKLSEMILSNNKINSLQFASECENLAYLDVDKNKISTLMGYHPNLSVLYAVGNSISGELSLPKLPALQVADLSSNNIQQLNGVNGLAQLKSINLEYNIIEDIGRWQNLPALERINLRGNRINELMLDFLPALKTLEASRNKIVVIPDIRLFPTLERLILSSNRIHKFEKLAPHPSLIECCLNQNNIAVIEEVNDVFNFKKLDLSCNPLSRIIGLSTLLKGEPAIYIGRNENDRLEIKWSGKTVLLQLSSFSIPTEMKSDDSDSIKSWIIAMDEGAVVNTEIRMILLGNGETGKTALSYYYRNGRFYVKNDRTHGININKWEVELEKLPAELKEELEKMLQQNIKAEDGQQIKSIKINIWDFGGQEFYHATHRLFMSKDVLYLILWNKEATKEKKKKEEDHPVDYWMKIIQHYAPGSIKLLVQNKADNEYAVDNDTNFKICRYDEKSHNSVVQYGLDMDLLKEGILKKLLILPNFGKPIPKVYDDIKVVIENLDRQFISFAEYEEICRKTDHSGPKIMSDAAQRDTCLKYMDNVGTVVCFRYHEPVQEECMKDYIFTDPKWLVKMIYDILGDDELQYEFDRAHVVEKVAEYQLSADLWIQIMKNAGLIFQVISDDGPKYIIPQYLPETCKDQTAYTFSLFQKKMHHSFTLRYPNFMPVSIFLRLISHYGSEHMHHLYWRNGLVFFRNGKTVLVTCNNEQGTIRVSVQDNDYGVVREVLERIYDLDPVEELEISIDEECFVLLSTLKKKMMGGKLEIDATNGETLAIADFKYLFRNAGMVDIQKQTKRKIQIFVSYSSKDTLLEELLIEGLKDQLSVKMGAEIEFLRDKDIGMGADWKATIGENIRKADAAIILVSAAYLSSPFIRKEELGEFFKRATADGFLILPVLVRNCDYRAFEELSGLQFFQAFYNEYGYNAPVYRRKFMPFDALAENERTTDNVLNDYFKNLADKIFSAVSSNYSVN